MIASGSSGHRPVSSSPAPLVRIAIVDADPTARRLMRHWLETAGYEVCEALSAVEGEALIGDRIDAVCVDVALTEASGVALLRRMHEADPTLPIICVTSQREVESAVAAMRAGAFDYVIKPLDSERLLLAVQKAREHRQLLAGFSGPQSPGLLTGAMAGHSRGLRDVERQVTRVLERDVAVMLFGEQGSGSELVAAAIHGRSARAHGPFIAFDAATHDPGEHETLLCGRESVEGVVTRGIFEQANGGVLYIEQVERLSFPAQAALCGYLSGKGSRRVDSGREVSTSVRVLASSTRDLRELVESGAFSEELYFRLVVYPIAVPPLRQRRADLAQMVAFYIGELSQRMGGSCASSIEPEALLALTRYDWPGNLRELENVVHRSLLAAPGSSIRLADLPPEVRGAGTSDRRESAGDMHRLLSFPENEVVPLRELERLAIEHALRVTHGSVTLAAKRLGIGRATLYRRIATLELTEKVA